MPETSTTTKQDTVRRGDLLNVTIESLAFGGEGIARIKNGEKSLVVFVEDVVPGDTVEVEIGTKKRSFARGIVKKIVKNSPERIVPKCPHFGSPYNDGKFDVTKGCGGCVWQFIPLNTQRKYKEQQVREALQRIGGLSPELVLPILGGAPWYYRNKMEFSFSRDKSGALTLGLHMKRRHYDVVELTECHLLEPFVGELVGFVRKYFKQLEEKHGLDPEMHLLSFTVRVGKNTGQVMMILSAENGESTKAIPLTEKFKDELLSFCKQRNVRLDSLAFSHVHNKKGQPKRIEERTVYGQSTIEETLQLPSGKKLHFEISPGAFFQPNTELAQLLYSKALEAAELTGTETVFDLYCGTGTIGLFCSEKAKKVYGIELNASAIENAKANATRNNINNAEFLVGDVQQILPTIKESPDVVLVDPPRNGLAPKVVDTIVEFAPKRLVYVSCNPTSFARDAELFTQKGYTLKSVQPVDQFPQTYHIECVGVFEKCFE